MKIVNMTQSENNLEQNRHKTINVVPQRKKHQTRSERFNELKEVYNSQLREQEIIMAASRDFVESVYRRD